MTIERDMLVAELDGAIRAAEACPPPADSCKAHEPIHRGLLVLLKIERFRMERGDIEDRVQALEKAADQPAKKSSRGAQAAAWIGALLSNVITGLTSYNAAKGQQ